MVWASAGTDPRRPAMVKAIKRGRVPTENSFSG
jgi:hypothetical protein